MHTLRWIDAMTRAGRRDGFVFVLYDSINENT